MTLEQLIQTLHRLDRVYAQRCALPGDHILALALEELYAQLVTSIETEFKGLRVLLTQVGQIKRHVLLAEENQ